MNDGFWYCADCDRYVEPEEVTVEETHDLRADGCGGIVSFEVKEDER